MSTQNQQIDALPPTRDHKSIVTGVDGSVHNKSAIAWAVAEAVRSGRSLTLVTASDEYVRQIPMFTTNIDAGVYEGHAAHTLRNLEAHLEVEHPALTIETLAKNADPTGLLVDLSDHAALVVVGKRGVGAFERVVVGSTSIGVAGRAACPTVVVPDAWDQSLATRQPVLLAIDIEKKSGDHPAVAFAFERAHALGVPVLALFAWQTHPAVVLTSEDRKTWGEAAANGLEKAIAPLRERFPDVRVELIQCQDQAAFAILEKSVHAQLVVLGRHTRSHRSAGFAFGSAVRAVLHYTSTPVAVVPE
jgi:nucleotide-binding universal stress UspA family protein